jgi:hypothetical protein
VPSEPELHYSNPLFRAMTAGGNPLYKDVELVTYGDLEGSYWWTFLGQPRYIRNTFWVKLHATRSDSGDTREPRILVGYQGADGP